MVKTALKQSWRKSKKSAHYQGADFVGGTQWYSMHKVPNHRKKNDFKNGCTLFNNVGWWNLGQEFDYRK